MSNKNCAETIDRMNKGVALGMLICGITYFITAAESLIEPGRLNSILDIARGVGVFLTMLITFLACYPVIKLKISGKFMLTKEPESFLTEAMHSSFKNSWIVTMVLLVLLLAFNSVIDGWNVKPSFYFIMLFGFMTTTAAAFFLHLTREEDMEEELGEELENE